MQIDDLGVEIVGGHRIKTGLADHEGESHHLLRHRPILTGDTAAGDIAGLCRLADRQDSPPSIAANAPIRCASRTSPSSCPGPKVAVIIARS